MSEQVSKDELLSMVELPCEAVELRPGKFVWVQGMSGTERDAFESSLYRGKGTDRRLDTRNVRARLAVRCIVDKPGGTRVYRDSDVEALGKIRVDVLSKIYNAAQRLSGVTDEDIEELERFSAPEAGPASSSS